MRSTDLVTDRRVGRLSARRAMVWRGGEAARRAARRLGADRDARRGGRCRTAAAKREEDVWATAGGICRAGELASAACSTGSTAGAMTASTMAPAVRARRVD